MSAKANKTAAKKSTTAHAQNPPGVKTIPAIRHAGDLPLWTPAAIILFTGLLYLHSMHNNFTVFDDDFYITNNPYLKDFSLRGITAIFTSF